MHFANKLMLVALGVFCSAGTGFATEVVGNEAVTEVCSDANGGGVVVEESFSDEVCAKYKDVPYLSDNRNPKPKFIMEPVPALPRLYLRRMRKAGSTTIENFIQKARQVHQKYSMTIADTIAMKAEKEPNAFIGWDSVEYESLNIQCVLGATAILTKANNAILVTHFRRPINRINSEYWSEGPGNKLKMADESNWREWMEATKRRHQTVGVSFEPGVDLNVLFFSGYLLDIFCPQPYLF
jgi:hypothetical protein